MKNKTVLIVGGIAIVEVPNIVAARDEGGMDEATFEAILKDARIGERYLRDSDEIEREYRTRREALMADEEPDSFRERKV